MERLLIVHVVHGPHQIPDIVDGVEDLGNTPVNVQQGVDSFHGRPDRVFSGEDSVPAWRLSKVADEGQVGRSRWHNRRPVTFNPWHEVRSDKRHVDRNGVDRGFVSQLVDQGRWDAEVVEPFLGDLLTGTIDDPFLDVVPLGIRVEAVDPDDRFVWLLLLEVRLTVDRPGKHPIGVGDGDDSTGVDLAVVKVPLGQPFNVWFHLRILDSGGC